MATTHSALPSPLPPYPALSRLRETSPLERNASTSSSRSTTTVSSTTSSLVAVEMRPPPKETRTAATATAIAGPSKSNTSSASNSSSDLPAAIRPTSAAGRGGYHPSPPEGVYGGRGFQRNGPRVSASPSPSLRGLPTSSSAPTHRLPAIITDDGSPLAPRPTSSYVSCSGGNGISPTTPRAGRFLPRRQSSDIGDDEGSSGLQASTGNIKSLASPYASKSRSSSTAGSISGERRDERRQSVASARSAASAATTGTVTSSSGAVSRLRETTADYVFGEELGRGSYSTVVHAIRSPNAPSTSSPIPSRYPPRQFAVKIINQAHLIQERKTKYAMIERDALVRLNAPRAAGSSSAGGVGGSSARGHRRGLSGPTPVNTATQGQITNRATGNSGSGAETGRRGSTGILVNTETQPTNIPQSSPALSSTGSTSTSASTFTLGTKHGDRRPSRSADPPEVVPERSEDGHDSNAYEDSHSRSYPTGGIVQPRERQKSGPAGNRIAPSSRDGTKEGSGERKRRSGAGKGSHPGIIKLYSTFNDVTSLYFVLELAGKGELLTYLRKYGSFNIDSARYYAALLLDTVEFMHERGVVHRDLKPENILLDDGMRLKVTDFGSAKLVDKDGKDPTDQSEQGEGPSKKRSFVGSADFVSPEVLRNEPALAASDVWAFGCIVYQLIVGKPPFRGATDYLTFQKILKREIIFPDGFDEDAKSLVEVILNLDPSCRPTPSDLKVHPFFSAIDWRTLWQAPAPSISTGITPPVVTLATVDPASDIWAVFEDEMSENGQPDSPLESYPPTQLIPRGPAGIDEYSKGQAAHRDGHTLEPQYDRRAAADAVWSVDSPDAPPEPREDPMNDLEPPRPAWMEAGQKKLRALSKGSSARTSSSSSGGNRTALTGLLETMGIVSSASHTSIANGNIGQGDGNGRTSRASGSIKEKVEPGQGGVAGRQSIGVRTQGQAPPFVSADSRWTQLLLTNETIIHTSPISIRTSSSTSLLPAFLSPNTAKRRQLILTDLPRLFTVKEEAPGAAIQSATSLSAASQASLSVKNECVFTGRGEGGGGGVNRVMELVEKGPRGFNIQTPSQNYLYIADTAESRAEWIIALKKVM